MGSVHGDRGGINPTAMTTPADAFPDPFLSLETRLQERSAGSMASSHGGTSGTWPADGSSTAHYHDATLLMETGRCPCRPASMSPSIFGWLAAPGFFPGD